MLTGQEIYCSISLVSFKSDADTLSMILFQRRCLVVLQPTDLNQHSDCKELQSLLFHPNQRSFAGLSHQRFGSSHPFVANKPCLKSFPTHPKSAVRCVQSIQCLASWAPGEVCLPDKKHLVSAQRPTRTDWPHRQRKYKKLHSAQCMAESFFQHISY